MPCLHEPDAFAFARELDVPRNVLELLELLRDLGEGEHVGGRERRLVGAFDGVLLEPGRADHGRACLSRDRLLEDGAVLADAEHVGRGDAVDDRRAEAHAGVDDALVRGRPALAREHHPGRDSAYHRLDDDAHADVAHAVRREVAERAPRGDRRPDGTHGLREPVGPADAEDRLGEAGHRDQRSVLAGRARSNGEAPGRVCLVCTPEHCKLFFEAIRQRRTEDLLAGVRGARVDRASGGGAEE